MGDRKNPISNALFFVSGRYGGKIAMLVLTRKPGERLVIADNIVVTVVDVKGDNIRIGIDAPREVKVYRGEIYDAIVAENREAALNKDVAVLDSLRTADVKKNL